MPVILNKVVREGPSKKETLEQRLEGSERMSHVDTRQKRVPGRGMSKCNTLRLLWLLYAE